jgi:eukaryotic-like serine/threonine-protein kinase
MGLFEKKKSDSRSDKESEPPAQQLPGPSRALQNTQEVGLHEAPQNPKKSVAPSVTPSGSDSVTKSFRPQHLFEDSPTARGIDLGRDDPAIEHQKTVISKRPAASPQDFYRQMPLADLAEMLEGKMLDHFYVGQLIGGGGMGAVFRGLDKRLDRVVAIKVIPGSKRDPEMIRRFRLEAQAAARLDHPNIARVFYVGEAEHWDYIVFEFIDGINIRDLVEMEGPLSVDDAVFYTRQVAEALQHAHERDVVHRDIKPSNILVTAGGIAKLVDMGLARDTSLDSSTRDQTASGMTLGTFDYISPEQARNPRDADVRSDLYSLGCSLFFMLTGNPPFPEGTALQKLLNHGSLPPPDPRGWRDDISHELYQIMMKLMAKRPSDRYQKPIDLVNDLLLLAELDDLPRSQGPTTLPLHPAVAQPTLLESHLPWLVATAFLIGSTIWLQSQSISSSFALPGISFPDANRVGVESRNGGIQGTSQPGAAADPGLNSSEQSIANRLAGRLPDSVPLQGSTESTAEVPRMSSLPWSTPSLQATAADRIAPTGQPLAAEDSVLIVSNIPPTDVSAQNWESSLYRAVQRWMDQPGEVAVIEVRGSVWLDRPLEIQGDKSGSSKLIIRGAKEWDAKIEVARGIWNSLSANTGVVRIKDAGLVLEDLDFQVMLRESETLPRTIFQLTGNSHWDAIKCNFSLFSERSNLLHLVMLGETEGPEGVLSTLGQVESRSMRLALDRCFIRGNASAVRVNQTNTNYRDSIQISAVDTLVAVDGRVMQLDSATGQSGIERIIRFFCERSTFVSAEGFAKLEYLGPSEPLVGFSRTSQACVFWSRPGVPHITIVGEYGSPQNNPDILLLQGLNNAYDQNLRILCQNFIGGVRMKDWEAKDGQMEGWFAERGNDRVVRWSRESPDMPSFTEAVPTDFELALNHFVPGFRTESPGTP